MTKWLLVYSSVTGNTKQVGEAMFEILPDGSKLQPLNGAVVDFAAYDVIIVGYWLTRGGPDPKTMEFLPKLKGKKVILFATHGALPGSEHAVTSLARAAYLLGEGCSILGTFTCQGKINPALLARRVETAENDPHAPNEENRKRWMEAAKHPHEQDFALARDFIKKMQRKLDR
ncbi:flavodoxin family protein [Propionispira raffinosivorans]|uniref:flavodoxin family protein n=1 Tax=Propionispira raffinosivorans TaxID=86959 RepID=UPI000366355A|nr:flavodoxin family protein [Propionispira raffinosivorans]